MSKIIIDEFDEDDDIVVNVTSDPQTESIKEVISQGLKDVDEILILLNKLFDLVEPFGDGVLIQEFKILYGEIMPNILLGNYNEFLEGLTKDEAEEALVAAKKRRKEIFLKLREKYVD
jgi:hypothetical protein